MNGHEKSWRRRWKLPYVVGAVAFFIIGSAITAGKALCQNDQVKKILFVSNRLDEDAFSIFTMNPDGSGQARLTKGEAEELDPSWSPDGTKIAFTSIAGKAKRAEIYVMHANGSQRTRLTNSPAKTMSLGPSWSPDGKRIAFYRIRIPEGIYPYVIDADGKNLKRLCKVQGMYPVWSPDGKQILFTSENEKSQEKIKFGLFIVNADGSNVRQFIKKAVMGRWSPDGKHLAYLGDAGDNQLHLFVSMADGTKPLQLTKTKGVIAIAPVWSRDGRKILFTRRPKNGPCDIFAIDRNGGNEVQLTRDAGDNFQGSGAMLLLLPPVNGPPKQKEN